MTFDADRYRKLHQAYVDLWIKHFGPEAPRPFYDPQSDAGGPPPTGNHFGGIVEDGPVDLENVRTVFEQHQVDQAEYERRVLAVREANIEKRKAPNTVPCCLVALEHGTCLGMCSDTANQAEGHS